MTETLTRLANSHPAKHVGDLMPWTTTEPFRALPDMRPKGKQLQDFVELASSDDDIPFSGGELLTSPGRARDEKGSR